MQVQQRETVVRHLGTRRMRRRPAVASTSTSTTIAEGFVIIYPYLVIGDLC